MSVRRVLGGGAVLALAWSASAAAAEKTEAQLRADAIVARAEAASGRGFDERFRGAVAGALAALGDEELRAREERGPAAGLGPLVIGASSSQLVYTPVQPCRVIDTRVAGGPLGGGTIRNFRLTGTGLESQGGAAAGCNLPFGPATAAVVNFVAVNPSGAGNLRAWAYSTPPVAAPNASIINYTPVSGVTLNLANGVVVPLCDLMQTTCPGADLRVQADTSATQLVADVLGYFERFPKEQLNALAAVDTTASDTTIGGTCTHVTGAEVTLTAPAAGRVVVRAVSVNRLDQNDAVVVLGIGRSATDCSFPAFAHAKASDGAASGAFRNTALVTASFDVTAGPATYYLNGFMPINPGNATVLVGTLIEATFHPN
jgi:hypothetical protein